MADPDLKQAKVMRLGVIVALVKIADYAAVIPGTALLARKPTA